MPSRLRHIVRQSREEWGMETGSSTDSVVFFLPAYPWGSLCVPQGRTAPCEDHFSEGC